MLVYIHALKRMEMDGCPINRLEAKRAAAAFTRSGERSVARWISRWKSGTGLIDNVWGGHCRYTLDPDAPRPTV